MRFRGKFRRKWRFRAVRRAVRAVSGITLAKRIVLTEETIPDVTSVAFDNPLSIDLLECVESIDEEAISNGTTIADVPLYSRMTSFKTNLFVDCDAATLIRWVLYKKPDGEALISDLADNSFHGSQDTPGQREFRKYLMAKGYLRISADRLQVPLKVYVSKAAMRRAAPFREGDKISLIIAKSAAGTTAQLSGFGTIYCKANA
jgi:hypothetical protein